MAQHVREIMNWELFALRPHEPQDRAKKFLLALEITSAPVIDDAGRLVGFVSLVDLCRDEGRRVNECMTAPVETVHLDSTIEHAADVLGRTGRHHLPVVDDAGNVVGFVSALDVVRGLRGIPAAHPDTFPHYDRATGLTWTNDEQLALVDAQKAPNGPGILALVHGGPGIPERVVWAEACDNVRSRVYEILASPGEELHPVLAAELRAGRLRFRAARLSEEALENRRAMLQAIESREAIARARG